MNNRRLPPLIDFEARESPFDRERRRRRGTYLVLLILGAGVWLIGFLFARLLCLLGL